VYKSNLIKESIRMGHVQLGDFYYARGDLQNAFKHYMRTRDYCTTARHVIKMCLQVVKCSIELGNYIHLSNYVQKAETALLEAEVRPACCVGGCPGGGGNDGWGWRGESSTCVVGTRAGGSR
jgi:hypothetical protein